MLYVPWPFCSNILTVYWMLALLWWLTSERRFTLVYCIPQHFCELFWFGGWRRRDAPRTKMVDFIDLDRAVKACKENPGVPTNVDRDKWPIQLLFLPYSNATSLRGRRILIVCSTLGNWTPPVPKRIQEKFVVILVKCGNRNIQSCTPQNVHDKKNSILVYIYKFVYILK